MDELEISGKRYISSKRAAKENGYHKDYIGQLIRAGKVIGTKVGRTWYVEAVSLMSYIETEGMNTSSSHRTKETFIQPRALLNITPERNVSHEIKQPKQVVTPTGGNRAMPGVLYVEEDVDPQEDYAEEAIVNKIHIRKQNIRSANKVGVLEENTENNKKYNYLYVASIVGFLSLISSFSISYFLHYDTIVQPDNIYTELHF